MGDRFQISSLFSMPPLCATAPESPWFPRRVIRQARELEGADLSRPEVQEKLDEVIAGMRSLRCAFGPSLRRLSTLGMLLNLFWSPDAFREQLREERIHQFSDGVVIHATKVPKCGRLTCWGWASELFAFDPVRGTDVRIGSDITIKQITAHPKRPNELFLITEEGALYRLRRGEGCDFDLERVEPDPIDPIVFESLEAVEGSLRAVGHYSDSIFVPWALRNEAYVHILSS